MNCSLCGEVCKCLPETALASLSLPRWVHDPAAGAVPREGSTDSKSEPSVECDLADRPQETALDSADPPAEAAIENSLNDHPSSAQCAGAVGVQAEETTAWRDELATRLSLYRARRKPRPPRYPSLRLVFDPPVFHDTNLEAETSDLHRRVSQDALARDPFSSCDPALVEPGSVEPERASAQTSPPQHGAQHQAKIIAFPRSTSAVPPLPLHELAEPVSQRPRILDVPNVVPPPPALGGITIESGQPQPAERLPGIDIPLQSAPLARRLMASALDAMIIAAACALGGFIFWKVTGVKPPRLQLIAMAAIAPFLLWAAYQHLLMVYAGNTPGLRLAKLELTCFSGRAVSRGRRRWRVLASYLSALSLGMGYAWIFLDEDGLCWHDRITHTYLAPKQNENPSLEG